MTLAQATPLVANILAQSVWLNHRELFGNDKAQVCSTKTWISCLCNSEPHRFRGGVSASHLCREHRHTRDKLACRNRKVGSRCRRICTCPLQHSSSTILCRQGSRINNQKAKRTILPLAYVLVRSGSLSQFCP